MTRFVAAETQTLHLDLLTYDFQLQSLSKALGPILKTFRQREFYDDPRFHASFAWALLDSDQQNASASEEGSPAPHAHPPNQPSDVLATDPEFSTIPHFPPSLIPQLQRDFSRELLKPGVGTFEAEEINVQIGKEVSRWKLI